MGRINVKQHDSRDCGAACLASVGRYFGVRIPVARLRQMAGTDQKGTSILGLIQAAGKMGLKAKGIRLSPELLAEIPLPAIVHIIKGSNLNQHYVVLYGIGKKGFKVMDPSTGRSKEWSKEAFFDQWTGVLVIFEKGKDFIPRDDMVSQWRKFLGLIKPHSKNYLKALISALLFTTLGLGIAIYVKYITDIVLVDQNRSLLHHLGFAMLVVLIMQALFGFAKNLFVLKSGQRIDASLVLGYFRHLLKLPQSFFDASQVGELISRINDAIKIRAFINDLVIEVLVNLLIVVMSMGFLLHYSWRLSLLVFMIIPLYGSIYFVVNRRNKKTERKLMENAAELESVLVENISQIKTLKQFGLEDNANGRFTLSFKSFLSHYYRSGLTDIFGRTSALFLSSLFVLLLLWLGTYYVIEGRITHGELFACYALMAYFSGPIMSLISMNKTIQNALIASDRLFEIMDLECEKEINAQKAVITKSGNIEIDKICFGYGSRAEVFQNFSLSISEGEITAIVGASGSGKSTLLYLLQKLYEPRSGRINIGGNDIQSINRRDLLKTLAVVPQQLDLFSGSIADNISMGHSPPDIERIEQLIMKLKLEDMINGLPYGLDTQVGQNGIMLSGGQRQLIAIARALYRCPEILLLDEATSALDARAESIVWSVLKKFKKRGKTIVMISHRLSSIAKADRIIVLDKGNAIEDGTHVRLLEAREQYYNMWKLQNHSHILEAD